MAKTIEKVKVTKLPIIKVGQTDKKQIFTIEKAELHPSDKTNKAVVAYLTSFVTKYDQVRARDIKSAIKKYDSLVTDFFTLEATPAPADDKKADAEKPKRRTGTTRTTSKKDTTKADTKQAGDKPREEAPKALATFNRFLETSTCKAVKMTPKNIDTVAKSLKQFERLNTLTFSDAPNPALEKELQEEDNIKAVPALLNSTTIRILITERDSKKKLVQQLLLKPTYMSPYSFLCAVEAHKRDTKKDSLYDLFVNTIESEWTCYDSFQFNPLEASLCNQELNDKAKKNTVSYEFVNIISE